MATSGTIVTRQVKPLLSLNKVEAKSRVKNLYKSWMRQVPIIVNDFDVPKSKEDVRQRIREEFIKNKSVKDIRTIDMLVIKGQMELKEVVEKFKQKGHLMIYFQDTVEPRPKDFLSKFMSGHDP